MKRLLFLSGWFPYPIDNGSKIRIFNLLKGLSEQYEITLLAFHRGEDVASHLPVLKQICQRVEVLPWSEFNPASLKSLAGFLSTTPRAVIDTYSREMDLLVKQTAQQQNFDVVFVSEGYFLPYLHHLGQSPIFVDDIELGTVYDAYRDAPSMLRRLRGYLTWVKTARYFKQFLQQAKGCTTVSQTEKAIQKKLIPVSCQLEILPNCVNLAEYPFSPVPPTPGKLIYTGSLSYSANADAVEYFASQIYPAIQKEYPEAHLEVTGNTIGSSLPEKIKHPGIRFAGYVEDIKTAIANSWASVVPLRVGGGTRLKILEALALGTPVISTSKGAQGLDAEHNVHLLIADTPTEFAAQTVRLLQDQDLRSRLAIKGRQLVAEKYDWRLEIPKLLGLLEKIS